MSETETTTISLPTFRPLYSRLQSNKFLVTVSVENLLKRLLHNQDSTIRERINAHKLFYQCKKRLTIRLEMIVQS